MGEDRIATAKKEKEKVVGRNRAVVPLWEGGGKGRDIQNWKNSMQQGTRHKKEHSFEGLQGFCLTKLRVLAP